MGGGAIMKRKPPALRNIGIDLNRRAIDTFRCDYPVELHHGCAHRFLSDFDFDGRELVYSDPPYVQSARKSQRRYRFDYTDADHVELLGILKSLPCSGRVGGWRASFRVRWLLRRFRSGPQSGSHGRVSSPPLSEPGVRISRTGLSSGIMHLAHGPPGRGRGREEPVGPVTQGRCTTAILPPTSFPVCRRACSRPGGVEPFGSDPFASACDAFRSLCPQGGVIG